MTTVDEIHQMTVAEYIRAASELGWERTELVNGVVYDMTPEHNRHNATGKTVYEALRHEFPDDDVRQGGSVELGPHSMLEPDVYVIDGSADPDLDAVIPGAVLKLVVEVSVSSLARDLGPKLRAYAAAGLPEVWVIDPRPDAGYLLRHTDPSGETYRLVQRFEVGENAADLDLGAVLGA